MFYPLQLLVRKFAQDFAPLQQYGTEFIKLNAGVLVCGKVT